MKRLTTDKPTSAVEAMLNYAYAKDGKVFLRYGDGEDDIELCEYLSRMAQKEGCRYTPEEICEGECIECDCKLAILHVVAAQAAELRERLKFYEDREANGVICPPCKVGDTVYFIQDHRIYDGVVVLIRPFIHKDYTTFHGNVEYECEDPFYCDGRMMRHQVSVVFQEYGHNTIAYFTRGEAEQALAERSRK